MIDLYYWPTANGRAYELAPTLTNNVVTSDRRAEP